MKAYTKEYLNKFHYTETDFIPCEICARRGVDIHHIITRKRRSYLKDNINNLMSVCRECHQDYGDINEYIPMLFKIHRKIMTINHVSVDEKWFNEIIAKYEG